jgi:competence protein ComGC
MKRAFTLAELLALIFVIATLCCLVMPALVRGQ